MPLIGFLAALPAIGSVVGSLFGGASKNRQEGRLAEALFQVGRDRNILDFARFNEQAPSSRLGQSGRADVIQALPEALANRGPRVQNVGGRNITSFGVDPAAFTPSDQTLDLATLVRNRAMRAQTGPPLQVSTPPQASGFDRFLNIGAGVGGILGGAGQILGDLGIGQGPRFDDVNVPLRRGIGQLDKVGRDVGIG